VRAFQGGATIAVIGAQLIQAQGVEAESREYVLLAREALLARPMARPPRLS